MKKSLLFVFVVSMVFSAYAQDRIVSGNVRSSEDQSPAPGVSVIVKGTTLGTSTDADGNYKLSVPSDATTLVFSFIGLKTIEQQIGSRSTVDVAMDPEIKQLSEVVIVGYGTQIKQDLTGNIAQVKGDEIRNVPVPTFEQAIQGRAAGVMIEAGNGKLGQGMKVRIRGASSVSAGNQPLYVVDNIPITSSNQSSTVAETNPLTDLNPSDIESIEILKDASAAAIYGSRAANGVILITTKRGKGGKTNFSAGYFTGVSTATNHREWLNTEQYKELFYEATANAGLPNSYIETRWNRFGAASSASWQDPAAPGYVNTVWEDQVLRKGKVNQVDLSASGGTDKTKFFVSGSYSDQEGILIGNKLNRLSGRVNLDHKATEKLSFGLNFTLARTMNYRLSDDNAFSTPMQIVALSPMTPVIDPRTGLLSGVLDVTTGRPNSNFPVYYNPLIDNEYGERVTTVFRNLGGVYAAYDLAKGLTFRTEFGYDLLNQHEERYFGKATSRNSSAPYGFGSDAWTQVFNYTTNNFFQLGKTLNEIHTIDAVVGMSFQQSLRDYSYQDAQQFPSDSYKEITSAAKITDGDSQETSFSFLSYFARANYKFRNKYLLGVSGRVDGSSRFGADNRYGFFPAVSAGWIVSEESFLAENNLFSFLKVRASYGLTGNAEIANFASRGLYSGDAGYAGSPGQRPSQVENPNLSWEQTAQTDIGLDFGFLKNRISGELDYYVKQTTDLLLDVNLPGTSALRTQTRNVGALENKGWEFVLNTVNVDGALRWTTSFNYARNRNKITDLQDQVIQGSFLSRAVEGEPIGIFYGPKYAGVDVANGDALYYVTNADGTMSTTNDYNSATYMKIGDPNPDFIAGLTNNFSYKGIDLNILFQGTFGYDVYNGGGKFMSANGDFYDNQTLDQLDRWQKPGDVTDVPQARLFGANGTGESSRYVLEAGYLRLKTVSLGYNLPVAFISKANLTRARIYVSGQNLLTFTNYEGWDPEVNSDTYAGNINQGIDFYTAPQAKTITVGVNLGF